MRLPLKEPKAKLHMVCFVNAIDALENAVRLLTLMRSLGETPLPCCLLACFGPSDVSF